MDFDKNLLYNFASIFATLLFVSATGITIVRRLKLRWPISVNCWFCNNNSKIYYKEIHWWQCPTCEQYNGFTKDGDYAYDIPEQSRLSPKMFAKSVASEKAPVPKSLCNTCNRNEELKVAELRTFETNWFYDSRLENFKNELESRYPLCGDCQVLVNNVLHKQSRWLTQYKMLFFKQKTVNGIVNNAKKLDKAIRVFLTMLTSAMMYYPNYWPLPFIGAFFQTSAFIINQTHKRTWDAFLTLLWICISLVGPLNELNFIKDRITNKWPPLEAVTEYQFITVLALIIGLTNIASRYRNTRSLRASFKKLESPVGKKNLLAIQNGNLKDSDSSGEKFKSKNYSNYRQSPTELETPLPVTSPSIAPNSSKKRKNQDAVPIAMSNTIPEVSDGGHRHILKFDENSEHYSLNESLSTLKTLTLGESRVRQLPKVPRIFKTKVYGSTSPDLFQRSIKPSSARKFILAPPKLKSVAQTSWVAGGYWQVGVEPPTLSRSSSQSSGFGSAGSNFGPSREPSVSKEIDKCSVVSDAQFYCSPRPNSANSVTSCCQHAASMQFARCESPIYGQQLRILPNSLFMKNFQAHFSPVHREAAAGCFEHCHSLQNQSFNASVGQQSQQLAHFNTGCPAVLTSPVWLPVLLCGSLVFNIVVFCTILLR